MKFRFNQNLLNIRRARAGSSERMTSPDLFLDRNERVVPYSFDILSELGEHLAKCRPNQYPELGLLYERVADWSALDADQLFITDGVSGAIKALLESLAPAGTNIVFPSPTFALYPIYAKMFGVEPRIFGYSENYEIDLDALRKNIDINTAFVFLPNPNVPIEGYLTLKKIDSIATYCAHFNAALVIDEVYYLFGGETAIRLIEKHKNLFIMRSFSKGFGLPGVRIGFVAGPAKIIEFVARTRTGYETSTLAAETVCFFLDRIDIINEYIKEVKVGLHFLKNSLDNINIPHNGGITGNFVYIELGDPDLAQSIIKTLGGQNIRIRGGWPAPFHGGITVTGAPREYMNRFFQNFKSALITFKRM